MVLTNSQSATSARPDHGALQPGELPFGHTKLAEYTAPERQNFGHIPGVMPMPNLTQIQLDSFNWFINEGLKELFEEISPIQDFTGKNLELRFLDYHFGTPRYDVFQCRQRDMTYGAPLRVRVQLLIKETGEIKESEIFMGDFPLMTETGTFVINGAERVVVSQLVRSPGVYFTATEDPATGRKMFAAKLIPNRGAWLEFETSNKDLLSVKVDRKRKIPVTILLRALGYNSDEEITALFTGVNTNPDRDYVRATLDKDPTHSADEALIELYKRLRPGDPATPENARTLLQTLLFNPRRYDLAKVGRYKLNKRLGLDVPLATQVLTNEDLVRIVATVIQLNVAQGRPDDIDHLGNRRVRRVGELIQTQFRIGLLRMERVIKERMSIQDPESVAPGGLINTRPVVAALREFFGGSQLSQFMDQTNPLSELTHKRRLSALGPGGLSRDRAGFDVRDVHNSHYGRICPIETPEGPNIGLIGSLATYAKINDFGFIETPYRRVLNTVDNKAEQLVGRQLRENVTDPATGEVIAEAGSRVDAALAARIANLPITRIKIRPYASNEIKYLSADVEDNYVIVQANARLDEHGEFVDERVSVRYNQEFLAEPIERVDYMDVSPRQVVSISAGLIPFLEHDDANRALMGANMQRQAVPLLVPQAPIVGTGLEGQIARDSGHVMLSQTD